MVPFFQNEATLHERCYHLSKQLLLQSVPDQQIPKTAESIPVRNLIAGINAAELRNARLSMASATVALVTQVIEVLQQIQSEHDLQRIGFCCRALLCNSTAESSLLNKIKSEKPAKEADDALISYDEKIETLRKLKQLVLDEGYSVSG